MSRRGGAPAAPLLVVLKVGGSLLDLPLLPGRLARLLQELSGNRVLLVPGGGAAADLARGWDRAFHLGEESSHRLALSAMALNARLLAELLPDSPVEGERSGLERAFGTGAVPILEPRVFVEAEEGAERPVPARHEEREVSAGPALPHLWAASSDSVAAWAAVRLGAAELVLLKSAAPPPGASLADLADLGYVDPHLGEIAAAIGTLTVLDLRGGEGTRRAIRR